MLEKLSAAVSGLMLLIIPQCHDTGIFLKIFCIAGSMLLREVAPHAQDASRITAKPPVPSAKPPKLLCRFSGNSSLSTFRTTTPARKAKKKPTARGSRENKHH